MSTMIHMATEQEITHLMAESNTYGTINIGPVCLFITNKEQGENLIHEIYALINKIEVK